MPPRRPLAVTLGEPAGIGPDLTLITWHRRRELSIPPFYVLADAAFLRTRAALLGLPVAVEAVSPAHAIDTFDRALPVVDLGISVTSPPGKPDASGARAAIAAIERAAEHVLTGQASAIVTNPIAKAELYRAGFDAPGHTEYLAALAARATGKPVRSVMMLWSKELAVVPVTIHIPIEQVPRDLTSDLIVETGEIVARDMTTRFGLPHPRLSIAGLNPHAGESGTIGSQEARIIAPAIERLRAQGIDVRGPLSADTLFHPAARASYDVVLTMYHDQALIPIKTIAFDQAVNVTLGLPFIRTSPDHGTAFDLAGTTKASPTSFIEALRLADRLAASSAATMP